VDGIRSLSSAQNEAFGRMICGTAGAPLPSEAQLPLPARLPCARLAVAAGATLLPDVLLPALPTVVLRFPISLAILAHSRATLAAILPGSPAGIVSMTRAGPDTAYPAAVPLGRPESSVRRIR
jgi:hypothetical protein